MAKYRIACTKCEWKTNPHYSILDCVKEKENAHRDGIVKPEDGSNSWDGAHDAAFSSYCPKCGAETKEEYRWF